MAFWLSIFITLGICIGSFLNVLIYRMPYKKDVIFGRSKCTSCGKKLKIYHLVPIFSWIFLGGKCKFCKEKISFIYPTIEILGGVIFMAVFLKANPINDYEILLAILLSFCLALLLALSVIDLRYKAVPDILLKTTLVFAFIYAVLKNLYQNEPFYQNIIAGITFAISFWALRAVVSFFIKKEAMGSADVFIVAIIGLLVGFKLGILAIYIGAILTLPIYFTIAKREYELAFVPFLSIGLLLSFLFDEKILNFIGFLYE